MRQMTCISNVENNNYYLVELSFILGVQIMDLK